MNAKVDAVTHSSQSTATMRLMSCVGNPTAVRTRIIVTRPALGTLAAPTLARVAVKLQNNHQTIRAKLRRSFIMLRVLIKRMSR